MTRSRGAAKAAGSPRAPKAKAIAALAAPGHFGRAALVLAMIWALLFAPQLLGARAFIKGDASSIRAFAEFSAQRWHDHYERTYWNPYVFAGLPATASLQDSRPQWLPDPLLEGFDQLHRLPGFPPLAIPLVVYLCGMIAMAALARRFWNAGTLAMVWAGLAWGLLPGQLVPLSFGQDWLVMSSALIPVIVLAVVEFSRTRGWVDRLVAGFGLSLAVACQFLAGHPQIIALTIPLAAAFALSRTRGGGKLAALATLAGFAALGAAMAAAVWWPAHLYNAYTVRGGEGGGISLTEIATWSAGLPDLVALTWPWAAGFNGATYWGGLRATDFPQFVGTTVFALGVLGLLRRDGAGRAALVLAVVAATSALLSLGLRLGPLYQWMYGHVPLWSTFRVAIRTSILAQLAVTLLSARGLESLIEVAGKAPRRWVIVAGIIAFLGLTTAALLHWGFLAHDYAGAVHEARPRIETAAALGVAHRAALDLGARALLLASLIGIFTLGPRGPYAWRRVGAIAVLILDLGTVSLPFVREATGPLSRIDRPAAPTIARLAAADPTIRVLDANPERRFSNVWIRWRAHSFTGNHPAVPREWNEVRQSLSYGVFCALAIRYIGSVPGPPPDTVRYDFLRDSASGERMWRINRAMPRAYPVASVTQLPDERTVLAALASEFDARSVAFTVEDGISGMYPGSATCRIVWRADDPDHLELESSSDSAAFVVIADTWFPGWTATIDGRLAPIHRVQHMLRGLAVPGGTHRLRLDYVPEGWAPARRWTWGAWSLWLAGAAATLWLVLRKRERGASLSRPGP